MSNDYDYYTLRLWSLLRYFLNLSPDSTIPFEIQILSQKLTTERFKIFFSTFFKLGGLKLVSNQFFNNF